MHCPALSAPLDAYLAWLLFCAGCAVLAINVFHWGREVRFLKRTLHDLVPDGRITKRDDLIQIKTFLSRRIGYDPKRKDERRPILRQSASETLKKGYGFCGENARVVILLFWLGGIRANRLYVDGPKWGHVVVEHEWPGGWKFFDAHADPGTLLPDEGVGNIDSPDIQALPNSYSNSNPWKSFYRNKVFHRLPGLRLLDRARLPHLLTIFAESPSLVRAFSAGVVGLAAGIFLLL